MPEPTRQQPPNPGRPRPAPRRAAPVIIVGSVMFSFISYWRVAAVVLCDMASTAYYIGGIVEQAIGKAAPWFILAVMAFSVCVGTVYLEGCSLFVRGGVYRVVKATLGGAPAKAAVSALLFDYILTGPISACSAGQYLIGWALECVALFRPDWSVRDPHQRELIKQYGSVIIAVGITLYFFRKNLRGIHESSYNALRIMQAVTIVAATVMIWSLVTLAVDGPRNSLSFAPDLSKKVEYEVVQGIDRGNGELREIWRRDPQTGTLVPARDEQGQPVPKRNKVTGHQEDPLGFLPVVSEGLAEQLRASGGVWSLLGVVGLIIAFGHSILAMSGEETMAQVYREVESPKLPNMKRAALIIFTYTTLFTGGVSFLAVLLIPDEVRMKDYADNLLGGLAMHVIGPVPLRLLLNSVVVAAGFLILSGAVNTSIIGSNGVLNRVAEDGVLPDRLQKPHPKYGTTHRILYLIVGLQLVTIVATRGNMVLLGEAYAFGVIWSFLFNTLSMLVLRYRNKSPREFKVPLNLRLGQFELPVGIMLVLLLLAGAALANLFTKQLATVCGLAFASTFLLVFVVTEHVTIRQRRGKAHEHLEQFTEESTHEVSTANLGLTRQYRRLVAIRSPQNLYMLERTLHETDPETTDVVVMTAKIQPMGTTPDERLELDRYDRKLMTAVIELAEKAGKEITPLLVPANNPLYAVMNMAKTLGAQELVVGASNKYTAEEHLDQMAFYWINLHGGQQAPLTIRVLSKTWDVHYDIGGGCRIPRITERKARSVAELRAAGVGVRRVVMVHENTAHATDLFDTVLTMLDPDVTLDLAWLAESGDAQVGPTGATASNLAHDVERASHLGREVEVHRLTGDPAQAVVKLAIERDYDLIVLNDEPDDSDGNGARKDWHNHVRDHAACPVCFVALPAIQREVVDTTPSQAG